MTIAEFFGLLGGWAAVIAATVWIVKEAAKRWIDRDLEGYKHQLKQAADLQLEGFRHFLRHEAFRHEKRFGVLHEELFRALTEIYPSLYDFYLSLQSYVAWLESSAEPNKDEKLAIVSQRWKEFREVYKKRMILIPEGLHQKFDELMGAMRHTADDFTHGRRWEERGKDTNYWSKAADDCKDKIKPLLDEVRAMVQKLLGHEALDDITSKS
jgi:hypothetical protein